MKLLKLLLLTFVALNFSLSAKDIKLNENVQIKPVNDSIIIFDGEKDKSLNSEIMN